MLDQLAQLIRTEPRPVITHLGENDRSRKITQTLYRNESVTVSRYVPSFIFNPEFIQLSLGKNTLGTGRLDENSDQFFSYRNDETPG